MNCRISTLIVVDFLEIIRTINWQTVEFFHRLRIVVISVDGSRLLPESRTCNYR